MESADENGIIAFSDELDSEYLNAAYTSGIFPWPVEEERVLWFAPPERAILEFDEFRLPRRFRRDLKKLPFSFAFNERFEEVIKACAGPRTTEDGTWITDKIIEAYVRFNREGRAVSFEALNENGELAGGLYGVLIGKYFAAESMFYRETGASKFALFKAVEFLAARGLTWMDVQINNPFLETFGVKEIPRSKFMRMLKAATLL